MRVKVFATIPFQIKPWAYDEMKNSNEKVSVGAFCVEIKLHLAGGEGDAPQYVIKSQNKSSNVIF